MIGFIVKHPGFGLGRVIAANNRHVMVEFFSPKQTINLVDGVTRALIGLEAICETARGRGRIKNRASTGQADAPTIYTVEFDDGLMDEVVENELTPVEATGALSPLDALKSLEQEGYGIFETREALVEAWLQALRGGLGAKALLSSRIDLRPHQAYVAATVLLDRQQRYLLADEVGLGKTIEAGIVIHDLLGRKPNARVLVLCPGALTQQWLCELYAKFSGPVFRLPELRGSPSREEGIICQAILSFTGALDIQSEWLTAKWDLVVIDEAHHLLNTPQLYRLAKQLSQKAHGVLLLSALPAQHREDEYMRLLALLEPERYDPDAPGAKVLFKTLYDRQRELGRKLGYIARRLEDFIQGTDGPEKILLKSRELAELPVLVQDGRLRQMATRLDSAKSTFIGDVRLLLHHVGDTYRINRRILRNRRARLLENEQLDHVERRLNKIPCQPEQLELDARAALRDLLQTLQRSGCDDSVLLPLARQLFQALCDPTSLSSMLQLTSSSSASHVVSNEALSLDGLVGYAEWEEQICTLWAFARPYLKGEELRRAKHAAVVWRDGLENSGRIKILVEFLRQRHRRDSGTKFLIFAGFPGLAKRVADILDVQFPAPAVARFNYQMLNAAKEKEVRRFKRDEFCWILTSDETGGEGRNFQFADELIHFDLPWYVSKIEQRIGRLDRLGRGRCDVTSNVLFSEGEEEDGVLDCFASGFEVFSRSISGLEFALRELEQKIVRTAICEGKDGLVELVAELKTASENERAQDESQDLLDEASMERMSAAAFRRVQSTPERDAALEKAFADYFCFIASPRSLRYARGGDCAEGVLSFQPEDVRGMELQLSKEANGCLRERHGTFRRALAQERPDLEFFSVGNEFFDAVCSSLYQSPKGRTYAVECTATHGTWRGFEFLYRATGNNNLVGGYSGLVNQLERVFSNRTEHCFIGENKIAAPDSDVLLKLRRSLKKETKDRLWWNFTGNNGRADILSAFYAAAGWASLVTEVEKLARELVRERYKESLAPALDAEHARMAEQVRQLMVVKHEGWEEEVASVELLGRAIDEWDVELEGAGYFSVNGGLAR